MTQLPADIIEAKEAWEVFHAEHLAETGHHCEVDITTEGDVITSYRLVCCDDSGRAMCCGHDERIDRPAEG